MTFTQELLSWNPLNLVGGPKPSAVPKKGDKAPSQGELVFPQPSGKPAVIAFLRHCGCPFAEKTFINLRALAGSNPNVDFIAVSHSDETSTKAWLEDIGGKGEVKIIVDSKRDIYSAWGLGASGVMHVFGSLGAVKTLEKEDGIKIRPTVSGSRWQTAGSFAVDSAGNVAWGRASEKADDIPPLEEGLTAVKQ